MRRPNHKRRQDYYNSSSATTINPKQETKHHGKEGRRIKRTHLVNHEDGPDTLGDGLAQNGLRLHAHSLDAVHHHEGTVGYTESGRHLRDKQ